MDSQAWWLSFSDSNTSLLKKALSHGSDKMGLEGGECLPCLRRPLLLR